MTSILGKNIPALLYGQVKANKEVVDQITATGLDLDARIEASVAFLKVADPDLDMDAATPADILAAAAALWKATFSRPEDAAPVPQNP